MTEPAVPGEELCSSDLVSPIPNGENSNTSSMSLASTALALIHNGFPLIDRRSEEGYHGSEVEPVLEADPGIQSRPETSAVHFSGL
ncbi:GM22798 [Drosophila sechellia]|uniref:GM22798 n=1 Tax=Drosophila sechellia TaxID=7238 RepID=B4I6U7_DROSE|nr:GM22798 [Drosophila sechellia]